MPSRTNHPPRWTCTLCPTEHRSDRRREPPSRRSIHPPSTQDQMRLPLQWQCSPCRMARFSGLGCLLPMQQSTRQQSTHSRPLRRLQPTLSQAPHFGQVPAFGRAFGLPRNPARSSSLTTVAVSKNQEFNSRNEENSGENCGSDDLGDREDLEEDLYECVSPAYYVKITRQNRRRHHHSHRCDDDHDRPDSDANGRHQPALPQRQHPIAALTSWIVTTGDRPGIRPTETDSARSLTARPLVPPQDQRLGVGPPRSRRRTAR